jgi:hypothetical protein
VCSCSEVVLQTMKNYKAHYSLSWFRPLLQSNRLTSSVFVIEEDEQCYNGGELRAREVRYVKGGHILVYPYLKGMGPFIDGRQLDNYKLIISISTMGFT